jgi:predicted Zn-dependent peptidase
VKRVFGIALLLAACGGAPVPASPPTVTMPVAQGAADAPSAALPPYVPDNPDAAWRYHLPVPGAPARMQPMALSEFRLQNGLRGLVVTRTEVPVVVVDVVIRWKKPPPVHPTALGAVVLDGIALNSRSIRQVFENLGASVSMERNLATGHILEFAVPRDQLATLLSAMFTYMARPLSGLVNAEDLRKQLPTLASSGSATIHDRILESLYPAGQPQHDFLLLPDPKQVRLDEAARFRDAELRPDSMTICVAGNITRTDFETMLTNASTAFTPAGSAGARKWPVHTTPQGVFLYETTPENASGAIVVPAPPWGSPDSPAFALASHLVHGLLIEGLQKDEVRPRFMTTYEPGVSFLTLSSVGDAGRVFALARDSMDQMKRVAAGDFTPAMLERVRRNVADATTDQAESLHGVAHALAQSAMYDGNPNSIVNMHNGALDASRDDVVRAAQKWLNKSAVRIVATGQTAALKQALTSLDVRPITVVPTAKGKK